MITTPTHAMSILHPPEFNRQYLDSPTSSCSQLSPGSRDTSVTDLTSLPVPVHSLRTVRDNRDSSKKETSPWREATARLVSPGREASPRREASPKKESSPGVGASQKKDSSSKRGSSPWREFKSRLSSSPRKEGSPCTQDVEVTL